MLGIPNIFLSFHSTTIHLKKIPDTASHIGFLSSHQTRWRVNANCDAGAQHYKNQSCLPSSRWGPCWPSFVNRPEDFPVSGWCLEGWQEKGRPAEVHLLGTGFEHGRLRGGHRLLEEAGESLLPLSRPGRCFSGKLISPYILPSRLLTRNNIRFAKYLPCKEFYTVMTPYSSFCLVQHIFYDQKVATLWLLSGSCNMKKFHNKIKVEKNRNN